MCCLYIGLFPPEPFAVAFVKPIYLVSERDGQVEVCVHLTHPPDLLGETVRVNVFNNESSVYIPDGVEIASMLSSM